ncbi:MAG: PD-(D/E)XK nuclease family protein [Niameybacter sp.]|uniref:PD-(D/E)XK nuclease family protein n=1 Tax=Niameybacter sp. TaxID=2033640 RepID=UPI002FC837DF
MVEFILGVAKSGKTTVCYDAIQEALKDEAYHNLIMLVPEQFNLQVQIELAKLLSPGLLRTEVMSFKNLAKKVLKEVGGIKEPLIDDLERVMILKKLLEQHKKELAYYKTSYSSEGFVDGMNRLITIFEQNEVDKSMLEALTGEDKSSDVFKCKMQDIIAINEWFHSFIKERFVTVEKTMERLAGSISKSQYLEDAVVWIDGFYGFTATQLKIIEELMHKVQKVIITLPIDRQYDKGEYVYPNNPFYDSIKNYQGLVKRCEAGNVETKTYALKNENVAADALAYLNENYLKSYAKPYAPTQDAIRLTTYASKDDEVVQVAREIVKLVRDKSYRYRDMAILVGDMVQYKSTIMSTLKEYGIPVFIDDKKSIHTNSLVAIIDGVLEVLITNWSYKSMMTFLRFNMLAISREDIDILENYMLEQGIQNKKKWQADWERESKGIDLAYIKRIKEQVMAPLVSLEEALKQVKDTSGKMRISEASKAVYQFLEDIQAYETIQKRMSYYKVQGERALELENTQIWGQVVDTLERLVNLLGDEKVALKAYKNILKTSFSYIEVGIIPPSKDQIIVGNIDRSRIPQVKALFVLGVNEGVIPKVDEGMPLFSDMDKLTLMQLCETGDEKRSRLYDVMVHNPLYLGQFLVYYAFTRARERLYVSTIQAEETGKVLRPSIVFYKLKKLFGMEEGSKDILDPLQLPRPALGYIGWEMRRYLDGQGEEGPWQDAVSWFMTSSQWQDKFKHLTSYMAYSNQQDQLTEENAKLLYSEGLVTNISQLELYRNCPCCYFIRYGLKASERKVLQWNAADLGTLFHETLERYPKELKKQNTTWTAATEEQQDTCIEEALRYSAVKLSQNAKQDGRFAYTLKKAQKMTKRAIGALTYQLKAGEFVPEAYEVSFGSEEMPPIEIILDDAHTLYLKGQIDRVDVYMKDEDARYIKVLDYKSGNKNFSLLELYHGLQLQLLLYLDAYLRLNEKNKAAGMFYFHIDTRTIKYETGMALSEALTRQLKQYKLSGLSTNNIDILEKLEEGIKGEIVPAKKKKDGTLGSTSQVASEGQFQALMGYMHELIRNLGRDMLAGKISARPCKLKEKDACAFCKYHTICQFDASTKDNQYDQLETLGNKEIWEKLSKGGVTDGMDTDATSSH